MNKTVSKDGCRDGEKGLVSSDLRDRISCGSGIVSEKESMTYAFSLTAAVILLVLNSALNKTSFFVVVLNAVKTNLWQTLTTFW